MKDLNNEVSGLKESIFSTITQMAIKNNAINLAQGFPDFNGPTWAIETMHKALDGQSNHQYAPSMGTTALRSEIAKLYKTLYNLTFNPGDQILVTHGATEALYASIRALVNPGDEVIVFEPCYDSYTATLQMAKAKIIPIEITLPNLEFNLSDLINKISPKTKLLILNTPHNPTGKVFSKAELELIADLAIKHDFYLISDEVYEHLTFDNFTHTPMASISKITNRLITISSIGKTLGFTGWKTGWAIGPAQLIKAIHNIHQFITFCNNHPFQVGVAETLKQLPDYILQFKNEYSIKRNLLLTGLKKTSLPIEVYRPTGTYFILAKITDKNINDIDFCQKLIADYKVATIPLSPFYLNSTKGQTHIRFCFAKKESTLNLALDNLCK